MIAAIRKNSGRTSAREVRVWDPLVRLIHWSLALTIILNSAFVDYESKIHEWIGYIAIALVGLRLIWAVIGSKNARFSAFPPSPSGALRYVNALLSGDKSIHLSHNPLGALMVYNIWLTTLSIGVTGYMMTTIAFFGIDWVEEAHEALFGWLLFSIALHLAGVAFDTRRSGVNLVHSMLYGYKNIPEERDIR